MKTLCIMLSVISSLFLSSCKKNDSSGTTSYYFYSTYLFNGASNNGLFAMDLRSYLQSNLYYFNFTTETWENKSVAIDLMDEKGNKIKNISNVFAVNNDTLLALTYNNMSYKYSISTNKWKFISETPVGYVIPMENPFNSKIYMACAYNNKYLIYALKADYTWNEIKSYNLYFNDTLLTKHSYFSTADSINLVLLKSTAYPEKILYVAKNKLTDNQLDYSKPIHYNSGYLNFINTGKELFVIADSIDNTLGNSYPDISQIPGNPQLAQYFSNTFRFIPLLTNDIIKKLNINDFSNNENLNLWKGVNYIPVFNYQFTKHGNAYYIFIHDLVFKYNLQTQQWSQLPSIPYDIKSAE